MARRYILQAIAAGAGIKIGAGHGPLNHSFAPIAMQQV
jgi:hydroxymethylpyrimidine/phosphomethylpyrimidine kinase